MTIAKITLSDADILLLKDAVHSKIGSLEKRIKEWQEADKVKLLEKDVRKLVGYLHNQKEHLVILRSQLDDGRTRGLIHEAPSGHLT